MPRPFTCIAFLAVSSLGVTAFAQERPLITSQTLPLITQYQTSEVQIFPVGNDYKVTGSLNGRWSSVGQRFTVPDNWSEYDTMALRVKNLESRAVELSVRIDFSATANSDGQLQRGKFILLPNQTATVMVELANVGYGIYRPPVLGEGFRCVWGNNVNRSQVFMWHLANHEFSRVRIEADQFRLIKNNAPATGLVDTYGQSSVGTWPGKVVSNGDFEVQRQEELSDLSLNPPPATVFGPVVPGAPTGRWSTAKLPNGRWILTNFEGRQFWSFGLHTVRPENGTPVDGRTNLFQNLPPDTGVNPHYSTSWQDGRRLYDFFTQNLEIKYGANWYDQFPAFAQQRLRSWGFNTVGDWSDPRIYAAPQIPFIRSINTAGTPHVIRPPFNDWRGLPDPYWSGFKDFIVARLQTNLGSYNGDPMFMGFYIDGEYKWANPFDRNTWYQVGPTVLNANNSLPAKQVLLRRLQMQYRVISRLNSAWGTNFASFTVLQNENILPNRPLRTSFTRDMQRFTLDYIREYYRQVRAAVNQFGTTALYLGARDHTFAPPEMDRIAAPFVDVISIEGYGYEQHQDWTFGGIDKPIILYEMHFGATDRGGWTAGWGVAADQADRAERLRSYFHRASKSNQVIGAHWFEYADQPVTGRDRDLENIACGFVTITDTPNYEIIGAAREVGRNILNWRSTP